MSPERARILNLLYGLRAHLEMPTFNIQTDEWKREWVYIMRDIDRAVDLINTQSPLPEDFSIQEFMDKTEKFLNRTQINPGDFPRSD